MIVVLGVVIAALAGAPGTPALPDLSNAEPQVRAAIENARRQVLDDPTSAQRWGRYGSLLGVHEFLLESVAAYETAARLAPGDFRWPYLAGVRLAQENPAASRAALERALRINDRYAPLHLRYAATMSRLGESEAARASYQRAVELDPRSAPAHAGLGRRLLEDGDQEGALLHLRRALELDPQCRAALTGLVAHARRTGDREAAERYAGLAAAAPKDHIEDELLDAVERMALGTSAVLVRVEGYVQAGRLQSARQELARLIAGNPGSARGRTRLGELLLNDEQLEAAVEQFRAAVELDPVLVRPRLGLARALSRAGDLPEARREYESVLAGHPTSAEAHNGLAVCLAKMGLYEGAAEHFALAVRLAPEDVRSRVGYGQALYYLGDHQSAVDALEEIVRDAPEPWDDWTVEAAAHMGLALIELNRREEAVDLLTRALAIEPGRAELRLALANLLIAAGRDRQAVGVLQAGLILNPGAGNMAIMLATLLATSPDDDVRDGQQALRIARRWVDATQRRNAAALDVLACACAEVGSFDQAIAAAEEALAILRRQAQAELAEGVEQRLELFKQGKPHRWEREEH